MPCSLDVVFRRDIGASINKTSQGFEEELGFLDPILSSSPCLNFEEIDIHCQRNQRMPFALDVVFKSCIDVIITEET
jgi:hypothetical protein